MSYQKLIEAGRQLTKSGISVVATDSKKISVGGKWGHLQERIPSGDELDAMFTRPKAKGIAIIGGKVSGNLYQMDFEGKDHNHNPMPCIYPEWEQLAQSALAQLGMEEMFDKIPIVQTPNDGHHAHWRVEAETKLKNEKIAKRWAVNPETGEILTDKNGRPIADLLIESKGEGGYALCPPSPGYELIQGNLTQIPTFPIGVHEILISIAKSFHTAIDEKSRVTSDVHESQTTPTDSDNEKPGDDYNQRGDWRTLIEAEGWQMVRDSGNQEYWKRPGTTHQWSATFSPEHNTLYVFSDNASPFEAEKAYSPFAIYTFIKHDGNFNTAAKALAQEGYGTEKQPRWTGHNSKDKGTSHPEAGESPEEKKEDQIFDETFALIEKAAGIEEGVERNRQVKAIIARLVDLAPVDQSTFIEKMKKLGLGNKSTLDAQLKEAIKAKKQEGGPRAAPSDFLHATGVRSAHGVYEGHYDYYKLIWDGDTMTYYPEPISSFIIRPKMRIWLEGKENLIVELITPERPHADVVIRRNDWNSKEKFMNAFPSVDLTWRGSLNDVQSVQSIVASYEVPIKEGTSKLGLHPNGLWILPDGAITRDGWTDKADIVYLPRGGRGELDDQLIAPALDDTAWYNLCEKIYGNLLALNTPNVMIPVVGYFMAAPFKPLLRERDYRLPHLSVWGTRGAGKSTLMCLMWQLLGHKGGGDDMLFSCTETYFVMLKLLSATTSIPIVFDEFKPYDMPPMQVKSLTRLLRRAYDGERENRGLSDQTTVEYSLTTPVVIAGEVALTEGALLERILSVKMSPTALTSAMKEACRNLRGLPLQAFCNRYIPFAMQTDVDAELANAKEIVNAIVNIDNLPERVWKNLTVMVFGFNQFLRFGIGQGIVDENDDLSEPIAQAVLAMRESACGSDGVTKVALDYMIVHLAIMAEIGRLKKGRDYVIRENHNDIAIRFDNCFAEFRKYHRETQLDGEILNDQAYRQQIKENHDRKDGYITHTSERAQFSTAQRRAVILDPKKALACGIDLEGFFGNEEES